MSNLGNYKKSKPNELINIFDPSYDSPSMIKIFLAKRDFDFYNWIIPIKPEAIIYRDIQSLEKLDLVIYTSCSKSNNRFIPGLEVIVDTKF